MRILVLGASGLIGSAVTARLIEGRHRVIGVGRRVSADGPLDVSWVQMDIARATKPEDWQAAVRGVDAVVNCAGVLQDAPGQSTAGVHDKGIAALYRACERAGVRRIIHLSAVGVDREAPTEFSRSKLAGDRALMALDLDWVILRPSVVIGRPAYGGSALLRGLASLPILPVMPNTAPLQVVQLDDLVRTIVFFLDPAAPSRCAVDVVGPRRQSFEQVVALLRRWMRWDKARTVALPAGLAGLIYRLGDAVTLLGWRPPVTSTAGREMLRGAIGDGEPLKRLTGIEPRGLDAVLAQEPASVQERWFAKLYVLKPLVFAMLSAFWIATGIISLGPGWQRGVELVMDGGVSEGLAKFLVLAGGTADILIGIAIAIRPSARLGLYAAFVISIVYAVIGTVLVPWMWFDPLGPMLKIGPIIVFNLVALAILDDR